MSLFQSQCASTVAIFRQFAGYVFVLQFQIFENLFHFIALSTDRDNIWCMMNVASWNFLCNTYSTSKPFCCFYLYPTVNKELIVIIIIQRSKQTRFLGFKPPIFKMNFSWISLLAFHKCFSLFSVRFLPDNDVLRCHWFLRFPGTGQSQTSRTSLRIAEKRIQLERWHAEDLQRPLQLVLFGTLAQVPDQINFWSGDN